VKMSQWGEHPLFPVALCGFNQARSFQARCTRPAVAPGLLALVHPSTHPLIIIMFSCPPEELRVRIASTFDITTARQLGRKLAVDLGLPDAEVTLLAAAISEVARNIVEHARRGELLFNIIENGVKRGLQVIARDDGPGIADVRQAMQYGYSTAGGLGVGLPGAKWLMDEFAIDSTVGQGTQVTMCKWTRATAPLVARV
jgi:serine/threonine-protein kinase RsbT